MTKQGLEEEVKQLRLKWSARIRTFDDFASEVVRSYQLYSPYYKSGGMSVWKWAGLGYRGKVIRWLSVAREVSVMLSSAANADRDKYELEQTRHMYMSYLNIVAWGEEVS